MQSATPFWETAYQIPTGSAFGKPSAEIISLADTLPSKASVLDLGCGEGRNALFLAERGFDVIAVDISTHGINKLRSLASERGLAIRTEVADMRSWTFEREFDLVVSHGCLHLIERDAWGPVLRRIQNHTVPGGYNVVAVFTDRLAPPPDLEPFCIGLFQEGELFTFYENWQVELRQSYTIQDEHPGGIRHTHPIDKIVARKPVRLMSSHCPGCQRALYNRRLMHCGFCGAKIPEELWFTSEDIEALDRETAELEQRRKQRQLAADIKEDEKKEQKRREDEIKTLLKGG